MKFTELDLRPEIIKAVEDLGFQEATPIQEKVIPHILSGKDVSGLAQTGTGKTGAFVIPLLDRWLRTRDKETSSDRVDALWKPHSYFLILVPTRELASQVEESISKLGKHSGVRSIVVAGGNSYDDQKRALRSGVEFVVGTPGRLLDLYKSHDLDLNNVRAIVFDEADRMFDMGFRDDMKFILRRVPKQRQFLLFSATLNFEVLNTAYQFGAEPVEFNVSRDQATAEGVDHEILHVGQDEKPMYLLSILKKLTPQQCIVFSNFKNNVGRLSLFLKANGIEATAMSSLLSQAQRNKVLEAFKTGKKAILVATDVAARGLDIKGVDLVINYELPDDPEGYVHRIGRTGRAGTSGRAVGLVSDRDVDALQRIENYLKEKLKTGWYEEADLLKEFAPLPPFEGERPRAGRPMGPSRSRGPGDPRRQDRPQGPRSRGPQDRPNRNYEGSENPRQRAFNGEHRDRQTGRHQGRRPHNSHGKNGNTQRPQRRPLNAANKSISAPKKTTTVATSPKSLTGKIKSFIEKLFR